MDKDKKQEDNSYVDVWELDPSRYESTTVENKEDKNKDSEKKPEEVEEVVKEGDGDVTDVTKKEEEGTADEPKETDEDGSEEDDREEGDADTKDKGAGKQAEKEEGDKSKEDAPAASEAGLQDLIQSLVDEEVLSFNEEKEYDLSKEGLKELIQETKEKAEKTALDKFKEGLGEDGKNMLDAISKGLSVDEYIAMQQQVDFSKVDLTNETNQKYLVEDWLRVQDYTPEEIKELIKDYEETGILEKQAKISQKKLTEWQEKQNQKLIEQKEESRKLQEQEEAKAAEEFKKEVLNTREISGFKIDKKQAEKLYEYITKPVGKDGRTQFQQDDDMDKRLLYAYMSMTGFDKSKLSKEIATKQAIKLKKGLSNHKDVNATPKSSGEPVKRGNQEAPKITWAFGATED